MKSQKTFCQRSWYFSTYQWRGISNVCYQAKSIYCKQ